MSADATVQDPEVPLGVPMKLVLGSGDHSLTLTLSALSLLYVIFLTKHVGLPIELASSVPLIGRFVDAITDPLMGRISDLTRTRFGRRRPYFLAGAIPFGTSFALLWLDPGLEGQMATFAFCTGVYVFYSLASTVVSVPYVALIPEVVPSYAQRTSVNAYRSALTLLATLIASAGFLPLAQYLGGGSVGFFQAGVLLGLWVMLPFLLLSVTIRERPEFQRPVEMSFVAGIKMLARHPTYRRLSGLYICGRIAMDVAGMILLFYFTYWLNRPGDFPIMMALFLMTAMLSLPVWVSLSHRIDKHRVFIIGCLWWMASQLLFLAIEPDWPRWVMFAAAIFFAAGYAVVEMMPWSMLGDVIDEDELSSGERREGVYAGFFTFIRKLGGALGVFLAGMVLGASGFAEQQQSQPPSALWAIRCVTALAPAFFLLLAAIIARGYRLDRVTHARILAELQSRRAALR